MIFVGEDHAARFNLRIDRGFHPRHHTPSLSGIRIHFQHCAIDGAHQPRHRARIFTDQALGDHDAIGISGDAVIRIHDEAIILVRILAHAEQVHVGRHGKHEAALHLVLYQHHFLHIGGDIHHVHLACINAVQPGEKREKPMRRCTGRRCETLAFQILQIADWCARLVHNGKR